MQSHLHKQFAFMKFHIFLENPIFMFLIIVCLASIVTWFRNPFSHRRPHLNAHHTYINRMSCITIDHFWEELNMERILWWYSMSRFFISDFLVGRYNVFCSSAKWNNYCYTSYSMHLLFQNQKFSWIWRDVELVVG